MLWNDVVIPCKIEDLHSYSELNYSEIKDVSKKKSDWMRLVELSEQQWRQMKILLRMKRNLPHLFDESAEMRGINSEGWQLHINELI